MSDMVGLRPETLGIGAGLALKRINAFRAVHCPLFPVSFLFLDFGFADFLLRLKDFPFLMFSSWNQIVKPLCGAFRYIAEVHC